MKLGQLLDKIFRVNVLHYGKAEGDVDGICGQIDRPPIRQHQLKVRRRRLRYKMVRDLHSIGHLDLGSYLKREGAVSAADLEKVLLGFKKGSINRTWLATFPLCEILFGAVT